MSEPLPGLTGLDLVAAAREIAAAVHEGETYGGAPYIQHPETVARLAGMQGYASEVMAACVLHDVPEARGTNGSELKDEISSLVVVEAVMAVTSWAGEDEDDKLARAKAHPVGRVVKALDATHNIATTLQNPNRTTDQDRFGAVLKYSRYLSKLGVVPTPDQIAYYLSLRRHTA